MKIEHFGNKNSNPITMDEQKKIELDILSHVITFCEENDINYFMAYGSLLGAVRHKGFIPWDDDIDLFMLRADYEKFMELYKKNENRIYKIISPETDAEYPFNFIKVHDERTILFEKNLIRSFSGVNIDIFPLDYVPENDDKRVKLAKRLLMYHNIMGVKIRKKLKRGTILKTLVSDLLYFFLKIISISMIREKIESLIHKNTCSEKNYVGSMGIGTYIKKEKYSIDFFKEYCYLEFENLLVRVPKNYDSVLKIIYGNYMELPPIEKRVYRHGTTALFRE